MSNAEPSHTLLLLDIAAGRGRRSARPPLPLPLPLPLQLQSLKGCRCILHTSLHSAQPRLTSALSFPPPFPTHGE